MHDDEVKPEQDKIYTLNADLLAGRVLIGVDYGSEPSTATVHHKCARCDALLPVALCGLSEAAAQANIDAASASHRARCFRVGDHVRVTLLLGDWIEGPIASLCNQDGHAELRPERHQGLGGYVEMGRFTFNLTDRVSRIQQPVDAVRSAHAKFEAENPRPALVTSDDMEPRDMAHYREPPTIETPWLRLDPAQCPDPLDFVYDGITLRNLLDIDQRDQREEGGPRRRARRTEAQRAAVSAHWSAQLRAKISASKQAETNRVRCEIQDVEDGEPW